MEEYKNIFRVSKTFRDIRVKVTKIVEQLRKSVALMITTYQFLSWLSQSSSRVLDMTRHLSASILL